MAVLNSIGGGYDRLRELAEADKDGRVVVLPVKPILTPSISGMLYIIEDGGNRACVTKICWLHCGVHGCMILRKTIAWMERTLTTEDAGDD